MLSHSTQSGEKDEALKVFTARGGLRGHKSNFFLLAAEASLTTHRDFPTLWLSGALLRAAGSSALPFCDEATSHFSQSAPGGVFP